MGSWMRGQRTAIGLLVAGLVAGCSTESGQLEQAGTSGMDTDASTGLDVGSEGSAETSGTGGGSEDTGQPIDLCPGDPDKTEPGICGCGVADIDADDDGKPDCEDGCPDDADKIAPGMCGCGVPDADDDADGTLDCFDNCVGTPNPRQTDIDDDGVGDECDNCLDIPNPDQDDIDDDGVGEACACDPLPLPCVDGQAGLYACQDVDLLSRLTLEDLQADVASDLWGWTDPDTGREYGLLGVNHGTVFVDVTYPYCPRHVGTLPTQSGNGPLRDIKVDDTHAFIVAEAGAHGMQVFDLTRLRDVEGPMTFDADAHYDGFGNAHNVVVDPASSFAYGVGTSTCEGGLHVVDVGDPLAPVGMGCHADWGYVHDAHCVVYAGPDAEHVGQQICVLFNGTNAEVAIVDVTDKGALVELSRVQYAGASYAHQGWLTEDHAYMLHNDEFDEANAGHYTKTYIWDVSDLDAPEVIGEYESTTDATDHNLYIHDGRVYQANYRAGVRILALDQLADGTLSELAWFDTDPSGDGPQLDGAFTAFPWYESGIIVASDMSRGVFILRPTL